MAVRQLVERAWSSLNETGANVPGEVRSQELRLVRIGSAQMHEQHAAISRVLMTESRILTRSRRASFSELQTGASLIRNMLKTKSDLYQEPKEAAKYEY